MTTKRVTKAQAKTLRGLAGKVLETLGVKDTEATEIVLEPNAVTVHGVRDGVMSEELVRVELPADDGRDGK